MMMNDDVHIVKLIIRYNREVRGKLHVTTLLSQKQEHSFLYLSNQWSPTITNSLFIFRCKWALFGIFYTISPNVFTVINRKGGINSSKNVCRVVHAHFNRVVTSNSCGQIFLLAWNASLSKSAPEYTGNLLHMVLRVVLCYWVILTWNQYFYGGISLLGNQRHTEV